MHDLSHLPVILVLLAAAVVIVALFRKLHASPVLGYLVAGAIIGPGGTGIVTDVESARTIAEYGVVFLLFVIGLELSWERLHAMRHHVFAVGMTQVCFTAAVLALWLYASGFTPHAALIVGSGLALSSTALVLQIIGEHKQKASQVGRLSLTVLLVQDLAVVPLLVLVPTLAQDRQSILTEMGIVGIKALVVLAIIILAGRVLLRPLFRIIASLDNPELFTALTLLLVLGTGWLTSQAGLSLALGGFIAGLLMAETEYRHQVEADVMPYKDLFLGLFFMAVGMSVHTQILFDHFWLILTFALALMAVKALVLYVLCRLFGYSTGLSVQSSLLLSQGGEFAFIVFGLAAAEGFIAPELSQMLIIVVTLSMALTPFAALLGRRVVRRLTEAESPRAEDAKREVKDLHDHVLILGFGRVGQTIAKLLSAENINYIALDLHPGVAAEATKIGLPVYYGDSSRREVLYGIGIERASAAIITINDPVAAERAVRAIRSVTQTLPVIARANDLARVLSLEAAGANLAVSEMFEASLQLGGALLKSIGIADLEILRIIQLFRDRDYALARGTLEVGPPDQTPYGKMLAFQNAVVSGTVSKE